VNQELLCSRDRHGRSERPKDEVAVGVEKALLETASFDPTFGDDQRLVSGLEQHRPGSRAPGGSA
jgi:hypothetical protein